MCAQLLFGFAQWSQRFTSLGDQGNSVSFFSFQPGVSVDLPLENRWAVRVRTDVRLAIASGGESVKGAWSVGLGIGRYWGRR